MKKSTKQILLLTLGLSAAGLSSASAAVSDSFTVYSPNGSVFASVSVDEANEDQNAVYSINDSSLVNPDQFGNATTLIEPDGTYSDIFGVASVDGKLVLAFSSDTETDQSPYGGQGAIFLKEGNGVFDATKYLSGSLSVEGYTAQFVSDAENSVPDAGATSALLGIGLTGIGLLRRKLSR